ncbi:D-(-)-3-hydroxybutyrate oligomer hydrolase [Roseomonas sp. KE2513]|uniref:3-hydroxybutyrate oligomer hydrolase family protein n=1 Tax=Roseomonas sp. KE2513 TaxID=2479202 RepID=UPI0018E0042B|nr:3-hydroxybutyrate oligomer hydrolase family protein [Roseomonas sp. KE2513]MBI0534365.1 D-(-)-3-hydroxybutyrate oligomer hydrolase [Roseomonas sp. KE2513]
MSIAKTLNFLVLTGMVLAPVLPASAEVAPRPEWLRVERHRTVDGRSDDLVTAGLGVARLLSGPAPGYADPRAPMADELRRAAMFRRGDAGFGFGRLFGPNVDTSTGQVLEGDGRIAGEEYLAFANDPGGGGSHNVAMLLQVPQELSRERNCILAVPVNGSSALFRDIVDFGFWGLRRGCAVVYTDKGAGNGVHDLESDTVHRIDGTRAPAAEAGEHAHFAADLTPEAQQRLLAEAPHRIAFKHAHSRRNAEAGWGQDVLRSIRFAFWQLNERAGSERFARSNTLVIVAGNSNGGGAALYAVEADDERLVDAVLAGEPQVQVRPDDRTVVTYRGRERRNPGRMLLDYFTFGNLYLPCAVLALPEDAPARSGVTRAADRCTSLREKGLLEASDTAAQAREALERVYAYGYDRALEILHAHNYSVVPDATAAKYVSAHGRYGVEDRVCGFSFAAVNAEGRPMPVPPEVLAQSFATAPGGAPFGPVDIVNDRDPTGPRRNGLSASPSTGRQDYNLDGALCLREMAVGSSPEARRVQAGIAEFLANGNLRGRPAIIVHGRMDDRVPVAFSSRPYLALNSLAEGDRGNLRYWEVENAEHFGLSGPGFDTRFVPLNLYLLRGLDALWAHLTVQAPLPPSQVVRTVPRGGSAGTAPPLQAGAVPPPQEEPVAGNRIAVSAGRVTIPD